MKNLILLLTILILSACSEKSKQVTLSGKISNGLSGEFVILSVPYLNTMDTICLVHGDGQFEGTVQIPDPHLGFLKIGDLALQLYCKPNSTVHFELDYNEVKHGNLEAIKISGKGHEGSELLKIFKTHSRRVGIRQLMTMSNSEFMKEVETQSKLIDEATTVFQKKYPKDQLLVKQVRLSKRVNHATNCRNYIMYHHQLVPEDTKPIPTIISEYCNTVKLDDYNSIRENPTYKRFVTNQEYSAIINTIHSKAIVGNTKEYFNEMFNEIKNCNTVQDIKDELVHNIMLDYAYLSEEAKAVIRKRYKENTSKIQYISEFENKLKTIEQLTEGNPSPSFAYKNNKGKLVKLEDLKGKYVYIDVWATWCGPCTNEIPHLKALEEEFHKKEIEFVSISVDTDATAWRNMVRDKNLSGIQLIADKNWESKFIKDYRIEAIPRFILLDKEGKIINSNCTRPSDPKTKETLKTLIK